MLILNPSYLTKSLAKCVTSMLAIWASAPNGAAAFSLLNITTNATHKIFTAQDGNEMMTSITTEDQRIEILQSYPDGQVIGTKTSYKNGTTKLEVPYDGHKVIKKVTSVQEGGNIKMIYEDLNNNEYKSVTQYANGKFQASYANGTTISEEEDGGIKITDQDKIHVKYGDGMQIITTKKDPMTITTIDPDGNKIIIFKNNGTIIQEDKYGGRIVKEGNSVVTTYKNSNVTLNDTVWVLNLGEDNPNHDDL